MPDDRRRPNGPSVEPMLAEPVRPLLREAPRLRPGADSDDRARAYASVALGYEQHTRQVYSELDKHRGALNLMPEIVRGSVRAAIREEREILREELRRDVEQTVARRVEESVPDPMEIESAAERGARAGVEKTGPHRSLSPTTVERMTDEKIARAKLEAALADAEERAQAAEGKLAAGETDTRDKRKEWRSFAFAVAAGVAVATLVGAGTCAMGKANGYAQGVADEKAAHPHAAPAADGEPEPASPPEAPPAAAAPPKRP